MSNTTKPGAATRILYGSAGVRPPNSAFSTGFGTMGAPKALLIVGLATLPGLIFLTFLPDVVAIVCGLIVTLTVYAVASGLLGTTPGPTVPRALQGPAVQWARTRFTFGVDVGLATVAGAVISIFAFMYAPIGWALPIGATAVGFVLAYSAFRALRTVTWIVLKTLFVLWILSTIGVAVWSVAVGDLSIGELLDS